MSGFALNEIQMIYNEMTKREKSKKTDISGIPEKNFWKKVFFLKRLKKNEKFEAEQILFKD